MTDQPKIIVIDDVDSLIEHFGIAEVSNLFDGKSDAWEIFDANLWLKPDDDFDCEEFVKRYSLPAKKKKRWRSIDDP